METQYFSRKSSRQLFHRVIFKEEVTQVVEDRVAVADLDAPDLVGATADHGARARVDALARKVLQEVVWLLLGYGLDLVRVDQDHDGLAGGAAEAALLRLVLHLFQPDGTKIHRPLRQRRQEALAAEGLAQGVHARARASAPRGRQSARTGERDPARHALGLAAHTGGGRKEVLPYANGRNALPA